MSACVSIVAAAFNQQIVEPMIEEAQRAIQQNGGAVLTVVRVPGAYEIPLTAKLLLSGDTDVLIVLGYIEKGETLHGAVMGQVVHQSLMNLQLEYGKPLGLGIIGPGATLDQAEKRKVPYARAAVEAAMAHRAALLHLGAPLEG